MLKRSISFCLLSLVVWNGCLGGSVSLLVCLHNWDEVHLTNSAIEEDACCHDDEASDEIQIEVWHNHCVDLELVGSEFINIREERSIDVAPTAVAHFVLSKALVEQRPVKSVVHPASSSPPLQSTEGLRVAATTVLRI